MEHRGPSAPLHPPHLPGVPAAGLPHSRGVSRPPHPAIFGGAICGFLFRCPRREHRCPAGSGLCAPFGAIPLPFPQASGSWPAALPGMLWALLALGVLLGPPRARPVLSSLSAAASATFAAPVPVTKSVSGPDGFASYTFSRFLGVPPTSGFLRLCSRPLKACGSPADGALHLTVLFEVWQLLLVFPGAGRVVPWPASLTLVLLLSLVLWLCLTLSPPPPCPFGSLGQQAAACGYFLGSEPFEAGWSPQRRVLSFPFIEWGRPSPLSQTISCQLAILQGVSLILGIFLPGQVSGKTWILMSWLPFKNFSVCHR